jgi:uncharacterized phiE125 gp8 family phage protein
MYLPREGRAELTLITPPAGLPITLAQAKKHCRVEPEEVEDDDYISALIQVANDFLDPAGDGWLGQALVEQQWQLTLDRFPGAGLYQRLNYPLVPYPFLDHLIIDLPYPPLISVDAFKYVDASGVVQNMVQGTDYQLTAVGAKKQKARLAPMPGSIWPLANPGQLDAVTVKFTCGYAPSNANDGSQFGANVPSPVKQAMLLMIGHFYENRLAVIAEPGRVMAIELPYGVEALLANQRVYY